MKSILSGVLRQAIALIEAARVGPEQHRIEFMERSRNESPLPT